MILLAWLGGRISPPSLTRESGRLNPHGASGDLSKISAQDARLRSLVEMGHVGATGIIPSERRWLASNC